MAVKLYINNMSLKAEDTNSGKTVMSVLKKDVYYFPTELNQSVAIAKIGYLPLNYSDRPVLEVAISNLVDEDLVGFTSDSFREFCEQNLGFEVASVKTGGETSRKNSTTTPISSLGTFSGVAEQNCYSHVMTTVATDQEGVLYMEFSTDGINWDSSIAIHYNPNAINPPQPLLKGPRYFRVRFENTSSSAQTYIRLSTYYGQYSQLTSNLESIVPQTFGAVVTRPVDFNLMVAKDLYQGHQITIKDGINPDIDTGSVPEDIWYGGGEYTGFPSSEEPGEIVVTGSDSGTIYYSYMESPTDTSYYFGSISISGPGTYSLGHDIWRSNYLLFDKGGGFNSSTIYLRHSITTSNVFGYIYAGQGQSFNSAYTVPKGHSVFIDRMTGSIRGGNSGASADCFVWYRESGRSELLRLPFVLNFGSFYFDDSDYLIRFSEGVDFIFRNTYCKNNNTSIHIGYRILKVKNNG